jgi:hypothetical protein
MTIINSLEQLLAPEGQKPQELTDVAELIALGEKIGAVVRRRGFAAYRQTNDDFNLTAEIGKLDGETAETLHIGRGYEGQILLSLTVSASGAFQIVDGKGEQVERIDEPTLIQDANDTIINAYNL